MPTHNAVIHITMMPIRAPLSSNLRKADDQDEALPRIRQKQDKNKPSQPPRLQPETYRELLEQEYSVAAAQRDGLIDLHGELRNLQESGAPIDWSIFHPAALASISEMAAQFPDATGHSVMTMPLPALRKRNGREPCSAKWWMPHAWGRKSRGSPTNTASSR